MEDNIKHRDMKEPDSNATKDSIYNATRTKVTSRSSNTLFILLRTVQSSMVVSKQWMVCLILFTCVSAKEQKFALEPQDQSAVVGSRVILPCRVVNKVGQLQWTKDDFGLGTHRHLSGYERYKMIGSDEEGDYSLDIRDVLLDDDAMYQCQVSTGPKGEAAIRSRYARLSVLVPPESPKILKGPMLQAVEDRDVDLECVSVGGKPAAEITWVDSEGNVLTQGVTYTVEAMSDGRRYTARSILRLRPRKQHHNQTFVCQAQNTADRAYKAATIKLKVHYAPRVRIYVKAGSTNGRIHEGDAVILGCQATANPNNLTFTWYVNSERVVNTNNNELVISNVTRTYNGVTIKCEVYNEVGKSADTKALEVAYGPTFRIKPQNVEGESGSSATLSCIADGHPQPKMLWLRYERDRVIIVGKSSNLSLTITKQSAGQYWCRASIDGRKDIEAAAMVYVKGPPKITSNQTQYGIEGDSVRIECISFSVPKPDLVIWAYEGNEINSFHNQEYVFLEETLADRLTKSTLIIRDSQARHFGSYNCTVSNAYGVDSMQINLLADKSSSLIIIIGGASLLTVIVLIIMFIVMLCHRKSNKCDVKKPDITDINKGCQYKESDRNSNISDLKLELRQIEGSCEMDVSNESETDLRSTLHLTTNLGLPLAGPVPLPESALDSEMMKQYQRYSGEFTMNSLQFASQNQNGYVPYVDYARDYAPPADSNTGSLSRSTDISTYQSHCGSLHRQQSCGRLTGMVGPDLIPMSNSGVLMSGVDVRYAATYGNPYLTGSGPLAYPPQPNTSSKNAPPPYYTLKSIHHQTGMTSPPPCPSSSRSASSPQGTSAQPQAAKINQTALYILPPTSQGLQTSKLSKGTGTITNGTHV
ncbi:irregular chiasm C-roughest protein-like isoform X2 [Zerene cesonia]|uniref:irregular chiasm C-roughest protein-like isoform X2 n=1 Tax=Zerene cesonia TaxID=33412 RepID=UPI0018E5114E|nr:irregular chiasm C-roughest protein-like isoform X2 [Zerene cesonia]